MIRFSMVKVGDKLGGARNEKGRMEDVDGQLKWKAVKDEVEVLGERNPYSLI